MDIIFLRRDGRQCFQLAAGATRGIVVGLIVVAVGLFYAGIKYGISSVHVPPTGAVNLWQEDLALQEAVVVDAVRTSEEGLRALAARLGELQARSMRLEALGQRLVEAAGLDAGEFDFDDPPPRGGPEGGPGGLGQETVADFVAELAALERRLADRQPKLQVLEAFLLDRKLSARTRPSGRPVVQGWRSSGYGNRRDPVNGRRTFHQGVDFAGRKGSHVIAVAGGVVSDTGWRKGYGNTVRVNHGGGYESLYAHNQKNLVTVGEIVEKGQPIALMGSTGRTTGNHVHLEILHNGRPVNPSKLVRSPSQRSAN